MWSSPLFWIVFAIALFWALGAYNRLMRLRSAVVQSFGSFDAHMVRLMALLGEFHASCAVQRDGAMSPPADQEIAALQGATTQLSASLAVARARPLRADAMAALAAARDVLHASWPGALRKAQEAAAAAQPAPAPSAAQAAEEPVAVAVATTATPGEEEGEEGAAPLAEVPPALFWPVRWNDHIQQNEQAIAVFNDAVVQYNEAIAQFPANLLAWAFGFKAARGL